MKEITIERTAIDRFKAEWPCHNIPADADLIVAAFADNGDLIDYEISDSGDNLIFEYLANRHRTRNGWGKRGNYGGALSALFDDARERAINQFPQSNILDNWVYA